MGQIVSLLPGVLATVLFPRFVASWQSSTDEEFRNVCTSALRMALFLSVPLACIFFVLRMPVITLLFERGAFSTESAAETSRLFGLLLLSAPVAVANVYLQKMLYAVQEMRAPAYIQFGSAAVLAAVAPAMTTSLGADGMALAHVAVQWLTCAALLLVIIRRCNALHMEEFSIFGVKILPIAMAAAWLGGEAGTVFGKLSGVNFLSPIFTLIGGIFTAAIIFYAATSQLCFPEALQGQRYLRWQGGVMIRRVQDALRG
jgi:peptidoglycan biosynthesis protein MviN/MurJ (putative lipid II flippase)